MAHLEKSSDMTPLFIRTIPAAVGQAVGHKAVVRKPISAAKCLWSEGPGGRDEGGRKCSKPTESVAGLDVANEGQKRWRMMLKILA